MTDDIEKSPLLVAVARIIGWASAAGATVDDVQEVVNTLAIEAAHLAADETVRLYLPDPIEAPTLGSSGVFFARPDEAADVVETLLTEGANTAFAHVRSLMPDRAAREIGEPSPLEKIERDNPPPAPRAPRPLGQPVLVPDPPK